MTATVGHELGDARQLIDALRRDASVAAPLDRLAAFYQAALNGSRIASSVESDPFVREHIVLIVKTILSRSDSGQSAEPVSSFLSKVLQWTLLVVPYDLQSFLDASALIIGSSPCNFFSRNPSVRPDLLRQLESLDGCTVVKARLDRKKLVPLSQMRLLLDVYRCAIPEDRVDELCPPGLSAVLTNLSLATVDDVKTGSMRDLVQLYDLFLTMLNETSGKFHALQSDLSGARLKLAQLFLRSNNLERRLAGLTDIKETLGALIDQCPLSAGPGEPPSPALKEMLTYVGELSRSGTLEYIFGANIHPELVVRSADVLRAFVFADRLTEDTLNLIWAHCTGKQHRSLVRAVFTALGDIVPSLSDAQLVWLKGKLDTYPEELVDAPFLQLVYVYASLVEQRAPLKVDALSIAEVPGCDVLWRVIMRATPETREAAAQALIYLTQVLVRPDLNKYRALAYVSIASCITEHRQVPFALQLLPKLAAATAGTRFTSADGADDATNHALFQRTVADVVDGIRKVISFKSFFDDMAHYRQAAAAQVAEIKAEAPFTADFAAAVVIEAHGHCEQLQARLDFLRFMMEHTADGFITEKAQFDELWATVYERALSQTDRDIGLQWLRTVQRPLELLQYLYQNRLPSADLVNATPSLLQVAKHLFAQVNWSARLYSIANDKPVVHGENLIGLDLFWSLAIEPQSDIVAHDAAMHLVTLVLALPPDLSKLWASTRRAFIDRCFANLQDRAAKLRSAGTANTLQVAALRMQISHLLMLVKLLLESFAARCPAEMLQAAVRRHGVGARGEKVSLTARPMDSSDTPPVTIVCYKNDTVSELKNRVAAESKRGGVENLRFFINAKELTAALDTQTLSEIRVEDGSVVVFANRPSGMPAQGDAAALPVLKSDAKDRVPALIISNQYFTQLFDMLALDEQLSYSIWDILMLLPTNAPLHSAISSLSFVGDSPSNRASAWKSMLDPSNVFKLLYSLQVIEAELAKSKSDADGSSSPSTASWRAKFVQLGGLTHLYRILVSIDVRSFLVSPLRESCLRLLLSLTYSFAVDTKSGVYIVSTIKAQDIQVDGDVLNLCTTLLKMVDVVAGEAPPKNELVTGNDVSQTFPSRALHLLFSLALSIPEVGQRLFSLPAFKDWFRATLLAARNTVVRQSVTLATTRFCNAVVQTFPPEQLWTDSPFTSLFFLVHSMLSYAIERADASVTAEYFILFDRLVTIYFKHAPATQPPAMAFDFRAVLQTIASAVKSRPRIEQRGQPERDRTLCGLLFVMRAIVLPNPALKQITGAELIPFLFDVALFCDEPLCVTEGSRMVAEFAMAGLAQGDEENSTTLVSRITKLHLGQEGRALRWNFASHTSGRTPNGHVGLRNMGATCYMNALLQQLFMIPRFRHAILAAPLPAGSPASPTEDTVLYQMQTLFSFLSDSARKAYDMSGFCATFRDQQGNVMNPNEQMDVDEFFNTLFERLEAQLKGTPSFDAIFKDLFSGKLVQQVKSLECPHVSERDESFFVLQCDVKGKRDIEESLQAYVQGEMLDGDNKYHCAQCQKKVNAVKRACVKELPETLLFHLKRFDFDMETLSRKKVNDLYEFPETINMEPYLADYIARAEAANGTGGGAVRRTASAGIARTFSSDAALPAAAIANGHVYKLAGVLVHRGTAESGHYYSFIRSREKAQPQQQQGENWWRFDDSNVDRFDTAEIPAQCFGGQDQSTGDEVRAPSKVYSAYMLVYERERPTAQSPSSSALAPSKSAVEMLDVIHKENKELMRDAQLYDAKHIEMVVSVVNNIIPPPMALMTTSVALRERTAAMAAVVLFNTVCHMLTRTHLKDLVAALNTCFVTLPQTAAWFAGASAAVQGLPALSTGVAGELAKMIGARKLQSQWRVELLLQCPIREPQLVAKDLMLAAVQALRRAPSTPQLQQAVQKSILSELVGVLDTASQYWRNSETFFYAFSALIELDAPTASAHLVPSLPRLIAFYFGDALPLRLVPAGMTLCKIGDKATVPPYAGLLDAIATVLEHCVASAQPIPPAALELCLMPGPATSPAPLFFTRQLRERINISATARIAAALCSGSAERTQIIIGLCEAAIAEVTADRLPCYFAVLEALVGIDDALAATRVRRIVQLAVDSARSSVQEPAVMAECLRFIPACAQSSKAAAMMFVDTLADWLVPGLLHTLNGAVTNMAKNAVFGVYAAAFPSKEEVATVDRADAAEAIDALLKILLHWLPALYELFPQPHPDAIKDAMDASSRLIGYFPLLQWALGSSPSNKKLVDVQVLYDLFVDLDNWRLEMDENKRALMQFLSWLVVDYPDDAAAARLVSTPDMQSRLLQVYVMLVPTEVSIAYNIALLTPHFAIQRHLCRHSAAHAVFVSTHANFLWVLDSILWSPAYYPSAAGELLSLFDMCAAASPDFCRSQMDALLAPEKRAAAVPASALMTQSVLRSDDDMALFLAAGGLGALGESLAATAGESLTSVNAPGVLALLKMMRSVAAAVARAINGAGNEEGARAVDPSVALEALTAWRVEESVPIVFALIRHDVPEEVAAAAIELLELFVEEKALFQVAMTRTLEAARDAHVAFKGLDDDSKGLFLDAMYSSTTPRMSLSPTDASLPAVLTRCSPPLATHYSETHAMQMPPTERDALLARLVTPYCAFLDALIDAALDLPHVAETACDLNALVGVEFAARPHAGHLRRLAGLVDGPSRTLIGRESSIAFISFVVSQPFLVLRSRDDMAALARVAAQLRAGKHLPAVAASVPDHVVDEMLSALGDASGELARAKAAYDGVEAVARRAAQAYVAVKVAGTRGAQQADALKTSEESLRKAHVVTEPQCRVLAEALDFSF